MNARCSIFRLIRSNNFWRTSSFLTVDRRGQQSQGRLCLLHLVGSPHFQCSSILLMRLLDSFWLLLLSALFHCPCCCYCYCYCFRCYCWWCCCCCCCSICMIFIFVTYKHLHSNYNNSPVWLPPPLPIPPPFHFSLLSIRLLSYPSFTLHPSPPYALLPYFFPFFSLNIQTHTDSKHAHTHV